MRCPPRVGIDWWTKCVCGMRGVLKLARIVSGLRGMSGDDVKPWLEVGLCGPACRPDVDGDMPK